MRIDITLPTLGEDAIEKATLAYWLVEVGDQVDEGTDLIELTTDKAAFTLPAPQSGQLVEKCVGEGDEISVGDTLCVMDVGEESA